MRNLVFPLVLAPALLLSACGGGQPDGAGQSNAPRGASAQANSQAGAGGGANSSDLGVVSSHGARPAPAQQPAAAAPAGPAGASDRDLVKTTELDKRIREAAEKAKAPGASAADRKAAAEAYLARGNVYFNAGQPRLYKYALADLKQVTRYDPDNAEAREKIQTIEDIYRSLGRPAPEVPEGQ